MSIVEPGMEAMLDPFIHETETMLDQLDEILLECERAKNISDEHINTIFRITHTIKGSAAMMGFEDMSNLSHSMEDVFYLLRDDPSKLSAIFDSLFDLIFQTGDFLRNELEQLQQDDYIKQDSSSLIDRLQQQAAVLKGESANQSANTVNSEIKIVFSDESKQDCYQIHVFFEEDCQMENMRAFMLMTQLQQCCEQLYSVPAHPENDSSLSQEIIKNGFTVYCKPLKSLSDVIQTIETSLNIKSYEVIEPQKEATSSYSKSENSNQDTKASVPQNSQTKTTVRQSLISVNQIKLDHLMDLVGELVTAESMVAGNPDLKGLKLDRFTKSMRELRKLTDELQDIVMSMRMVPLQGTFHKMDRIVRDMSRKLSKNAQLITLGAETEVDKTINDAIVDPLMHMIRNSMDHAIEPPEQRIALGKPELGQITLSARNIGGEILIELSDDGCGLDAQKLLAKAKQNGILTKPEHAYTDKEAFGLIMLAGFSTNTSVTEFSGRGVGMDVVRKNIEQVGGTISIDSAKNKGTTFTIKIPLTLAIVNGMNLSVGDTVFTLPITSIRQSFKLSQADQLIRNTDGSEMILLRGECLPVIRLHTLLDLPTACTNLTDGIMIQIESSHGSACLFADELLGEYQVVVKPFPPFLNRFNLKGHGLSGCSILGDGSISLILDVNALLNTK